ncbi:MAG: hypothetical protein WC503_00980 [Candidatus Shapirobacteria bacterium]
MSKDLVKRIDLLLAENLTATLAKTAAVVATPVLLKFVVSLITKLVGKLTNTEDSKNYYRDLRDKIDFALKSKGFAFDRVIKSDPDNPGHGDTVVFKSAQTPLDIKVHFDNYNPVRITITKGTEIHSIDLPSYRKRNKNAVYTGIKFL